jgi:hypothetical protein
MQSSFCIALLYHDQGEKISSLPPIAGASTFVGTSTIRNMTPEAGWISVCPDGEQRPLA